MSDLIPPAETPAAPAVPPVQESAEDPNKKLADLFRGFIAASSKHRDSLLPGWRTNVNYRMQKPFGGSPSDIEGSNEDKVAIPEDWSRTRQKTAQLSFQLPKILARATRPEFEDSAPIITAAVNEKLARECRADYVLDECLSDVVNAAGLMVARVGIDVRTETTEHEVAIPPIGVDEFNQPIPDPAGTMRVESRTRKIYQKFRMDRVSPGAFLWPAEFSQSDWDKAPWLGHESWWLLESARKVFNLGAEFKVEGSRPNLLSADVLPEEVKAAPDKYVRVTEIWYYASHFDPTKLHPECIGRMIFVEGKDEPVEIGETDWQVWVDEVPPTPPVPPQKDPMTGQEIAAGTPGKPGVPGHYDGLTKLPIRVATLTYVSDLATPPSDSAAGRPQVREMMRSRSQMIRQRDHAIPIRWFDTNRLDDEIVEKLRNGEWQDMIPVNGPGDRVIGEVARAAYPRENFQFAGVISGDLDRSWSLSSNQLASLNSSERSAAEIKSMGGANAVRLDYEKGRIGRFVAESGDVLFSLMQRFLTEDEYVNLVGQDGVERLKKVPAEALAGTYAFTFKVDSSDRVDIETQQGNAIKVYNLMANSPSINRQALEKEILLLHGLDPAKIQVQPPQKGPDAANISFRFGGEDLINPVAVAVMLKSGYDLGPEDITAAQTLIKDALEGMANNPAGTGKGPLPGGPTALPPAAGVGPVDDVTPPDANEPILKRLGDGTRMS